MKTYDAHLRGMAIHPFFVLLLQIGGNPADETALLFPILVKVEYLHYDVIELVRAIRARAFIHQQFCSQFEKLASANSLSFAFYSVNRTS